MAHENNHTREYFIWWGVSSAPLWKGPNVVCIKRRHSMFAGWWSHRNRHEQHQFIGRTKATHSNCTSTLFIGQRCHNGNLDGESESKREGEKKMKMIKITQNIMILLWDNFICCRMASYIYESLINANRCDFSLFHFSSLWQIKLSLCILNNVINTPKKWIWILTHGAMTMLLLMLMLMMTNHNYNNNHNYNTVWFSCKIKIKIKSHNNKRMIRSHR